MAARRPTKFIKCSECGKHLPDTGAEEISCHYCGKKTVRADVMGDKDRETRRLIIIELTYKTKVQRVLKNIGISLGLGIILLSLIPLFAKRFEFNEIMIFIAIFTIGLIWMIVGVISSRRYTENNSKLQDLTGGRGLFG